MSDPEDEDGDTCWNNLESFRVKLISVIDPSRLTPYLRQCRVINHDDEEQVLNDPSLVLRKRKTGLLLDLLQRTGKKGFVAFLESLELYYPHLYKKITGNDPTRVFSMIIDTAGESGLMEVLMSEVSKLQAAVREERQKVQELNMTLSTKEDTIKEMRVRDSVLRKYQERAHKVKEERDSLSKELMLCREENYKMAMNYAKQSEEKNVALMKNRDLQLEIDCLRHSLTKAEDHCSLERKHTLNLKQAMEQRPSHEAVWEIQREKDLLLAKNKELESTLQVTKNGSSEKDGVPLQALEAEWRRVLKEQQELVNTACDLRQMLQRAEDGRDKLVGEKELLELRCTSLQNDNQIYQNRIKAILKQLEEVAAERDQVRIFLTGNISDPLAILHRATNQLDSHTPDAEATDPPPSPQTHQQSPPTPQVDPGYRDHFVGQVFLLSNINSSDTGAVAGNEHSLNASGSAGHRCKVHRPTIFTHL
uniref:Caspase recruitment domain family member 9 n=1 Tax=Laticauda laticaudata TaxID=8630 RepID=A0A8C5WRP0_LATLA